MNGFRNLDPAWRAILLAATPIYLLANIYLLILGETTAVVLLFAYATFMLMLAWLTRRITEPFAVEGQKPSEGKAKLWAQLGVILAVILLTGVYSQAIPVWSSMVAWFRELGESTLPAEWFGGPGNVVANPVQYFVIPFLLLLLLGARPRELGFAKGHKSWLVSLVWLALPFVLMVGLMVTGNLGPQAFIRRIISNTFQNGFFEEFLFRGALQTRLNYFLAAPWTLATQALVFGLWHLRANTVAMDGNLLAGLALCLVSQTVSGFVFGYIFLRTRNLLAPTVAHVAMNVLGQSFG
jgi:membrane protease YdiL (CAAX protease family)